MAILGASSNIAQWLDVKVLEVIFVTIGGWNQRVDSLMKYCGLCTLYIYTRLRLYTNNGFNLLSESQYIGLAQTRNVYAILSKSYITQPQIC